MAEHKVHDTKGSHDMICGGAKKAQQMKRRYREPSSIPLGINENAKLVT